MMQWNILFFSTGSTKSRSNEKFKTKYYSISVGTIKRDRERSFP